MGAIGSKTRMSSYLLVRIAFGDIGAAFVNIAFAISLLGWFGVNINIFADAVTRLAVSNFDLALPALPVAIFASLCMTITTLIGFRAINILAMLMIPVLVVVTFILAYSSLGEQSLSSLLAIEKTATLSLGGGISAIVGAIIIGAIILPDITRFIGPWRGAVYSAFLAYVVVQIIVMGAASMAGAATGQTEILDVMLALGLGIGAFLIVITGSWILNSLNLYSTVLSVQATFPQWSSRWLTVILGFVGIAAGLMNIFDYFLTFLFYLSVIFVPVAGVIIIDFVMIRRHDYHIDTLSNNKRFNMKGFAAWALGAVISILSAESIIGNITAISALDAMLVSATVYLILSWADRKPSTSKENAS